MPEALSMAGPAQFESFSENGRPGPVDVCPSRFNSVPDVLHLTATSAHSSQSDGLPADSFKTGSHLLRSQPFVGCGRSISSTSSAFERAGRQQFACMISVEVGQQ